MAFSRWWEEVAVAQVGHRPRVRVGTWCCPISWKAPGGVLCRRECSRPRIPCGRRHAATSICWPAAAVQAFPGIAALNPPVRGRSSCPTACDQVVCHGLSRPLADRSAGVQTWIYVGATYHAHHPAPIRRMDRRGSISRDPRPSPSRAEEADTASTLLSYQGSSRSSWQWRSAPKGAHLQCIADLANALLTTVPETWGRTLDSNRSQRVVWAGRLARGGLRLDPQILLKSGSP